MSEFLKAKRIEVPSYARQPTIDVDEDEGGAKSLSAFKPRLPLILEALGIKLEREFNDPEIVFLDPDDGFPVKEELSGEYYLSDTSYFGDDDDHTAMIMLHCLGKEAQTPTEGQEADFDYLGMEMTLYLSKETGEVSYDEHFTSSSI